MKTLEHILQDVAKEHNCKDWTVLRNSLYGNRIKFDGIWLDVAHRYALEVAKETQRRCAENARMSEEGVFYCECGHEHEYYDVDKSSILAPKNLAI